MSSGGDERAASGGRRFFRRRWFWWPVGIVVGLVLAGLIAFNVSPRPGTWLIRMVFEAGSASTKRALEAHAPAGVASILDQPYRVDDDDALLDVYFPEASDQPGVRLPTLIWTHGGAWVSGSKYDVAPYFQLIAVEGFTVVSLDYSLAPGATYPTPVHQVNDALAYVQQNAERFHVDVERIVMGGDSAGAQITSQYAALVTNPTYAAEVGIAPSLPPERLRGLVLFCGIYDMETFWERANLPGGPDFTTRLVRWGSRTVGWAYTGSRDPDDDLLREMSSIAHVTAGYPPAIISGGQDDPLTDDQSRPLATTLEGLGVEVWTRFYPDDHEPSLGHLYQFDLDIADGRETLAQTLAFMRQQTGS